MRKLISMNHRKVVKSRKRNNDSFIQFPVLKFNNSLFSLDYKTGFGGQYGVQADRVDKSALGWDHR